MEYPIYNSPSIDSVRSITHTYRCRKERQTERKSHREPGREGEREGGRKRRRKSGKIFTSRGLGAGRRELFILFLQISCKFILKINYKLN